MKAESSGPFQTDFPAAEAPRPGTYADLPPDLAPAYLALYEKALPLLGTRTNDVHTRVVCQFLLALLAAEGGDPHIAVPAVILHDIGWIEIPPELHRRAYGPNSFDEELSRLHETTGARLGRALLTAEGYPADLVGEICRIIETHDSGSTALTIEEAVVKDADKLWRVSRVGFAKDLERMRDMTPEVLYEEAVRKLPQWFLTPTARALGREELEARGVEYGLP